MGRINIDDSGLNPAQLKAAKHILGPLLVIAGPGTGKTQLLSHRVAEILRQTDATASNILCLTFTNKAAANMRIRLQKLIGPDALNVNVKTFHSFAAEVMGEYPDHFWNGAELSTAPDAVQTEIINNILTSLPLDNPLSIKFAGQFTSTKRVSNGLKLAKEAGLTPDKLEAIIMANLSYVNEIEPRLIEILSPALSYKKLENIQLEINKLPDQPIDETIAPLMSLGTVIKDSLSSAILADEGTNKTAHTGEWKKQFIQTEAKIKGMHKQRRANNWWLELARVYRMYRQELHNRGHYDYADMLVEVISQAEQTPELLSDLQERYQYVLIDEFQDSNAAQMRLAHLIASHHVNEGNPNLMVVGDDDQSIYKFNGAELNNMLNFRRMYPECQTIVLTENYRSSADILDTAKNTIEIAEDRLVKRESDISKDLIAKNPPKTKSIIEHLIFPSIEDQYYGIAKQINSKFDSTEESIAVLARNHASLLEIAGQLHAHNVPVRYERQQNILDNEAVVQVLSVCKIAQGITDGDESQVNQNIATVLGHKAWGMDPKSLWKLAIDNRYNPHWLDSLLDHEDNNFKSIGHWLIWLSQQSRSNSLIIILDYVLGLRESADFISPIKSYFIDPKKTDSSYMESLAAIQRLRNVASEYAGNDQPSLVEFIKFIKLHEQNNLQISNESVFVTADRAVELLTIHKAKGLEFDAVYLVDAVEKQWKPGRSSTTTPINLPLQPYGDDMDDYVRLMYVAVTRARHDFIASSYAFNGSGEEIVPTPLIAKIPQTIVGRTDQPDVTDVLESALTWPRLNINDEKLLLSSVLENYTLNVTAMQHFLDLSSGGPITFLHNNLLRLPGARTVYTAYGTAMHSALEYAQRLVNKGEFDIGEVKTKFESAVSKEPILPDERDRWTDHGNQLLDILFNEQRIIMPEEGTPEQKLNDIEIGGAIIGGTLDHIIVEGNDVLISDYKTGTGITSFYSKNKAHQVKIWKHKMQLIFYALLAQQFPAYKGKHITCRMLYVEAEDIKNISKTYEPSPDDIEHVRKLTSAVYSKIINYDLPDVSKYSQDIDGILQFEQDLIDGKI